MASDPALAQSLNLYHPGEHHLPLPGNSLRNYLMQLAVLPKALPPSEPNRQLAGRSESWGALGLLLTCPRLEAGRHLGPSHLHQGSAEAATNCRSLDSSRQVAEGQLQAASDSDLHWSPLQESPEPTHPVGGLKTNQSMTQLAPQVAHLKGDPKSHQTQLGQIPLCRVSPHTTAWTM